MKKFISGVVALAICTSMVSCGSDSSSTNDEVSNGSDRGSLDDKVTQTTTVTTEQEEVVPEYNTFGMSVKELVSKLNSSGSFTQTWSADCTTEELEDGKGSFKTNNLIIGSTWSGTYEIATNNIIDITISYPCDDNGASGAIVACAASEPIMEHLFNIDQDTAMSEWLLASKEGNKGYDYGDYNIYVGYNSIISEMETIIKPKNELK